MQQNNFETVKASLPIGQLAAHYNSQVKQKFLEPCPCCNHKGCCSFDEVKGVFKCFSCEAKGSVIDMIMAVDNCTDVEALKRGAEIAGVELEQSQKTERVQPQETEKQRMYRLTAAFYERAMAEPGCKGKEWFCGTRGHKEVVLKRMRVGWAPAGGGLIPYLEEQGFKVDTIIKFGLASNTRKEKTVDPYEWYRGVAVFPIVDHDGHVIAFTAKDPEKKNVASFMRGPKGAWFINHAALGRYDELIVVEGENDVASLMDAGFPNVIGTAGGPTLEQIKLIRNFCSGATLFTWFDKDPGRDPRKKSGGGIQYTRKIIEGLKDDNIEVKVIVHPGSTKDADEYLRGGYAA